jgi:hypothetical protein
LPGPWAPKRATGSEFDLDAEALEVRDRLFDRRRPDEAQVRSAPPGATGGLAFGSPSAPGPWTFSWFVPKRDAYPASTGTTSAPTTVA